MCCGRPASCTLSCLANPRLATDLAEVGGLGFSELTQSFPKVTICPSYVPVVQHRYLGTQVLNLPWAAIPLRELFKLRNGTLRPIADTPSQLRHLFKLRPNTAVLALGVDKDKHLERYWAHSFDDLCAENLAKLGIALAITPNFSMFLDEPRTQHLLNRKRILLSADDWARQGIPPVLTLQAVTEKDWSYWREFLISHEEVDTVALEFQTGLGNPGIGTEALHRVAQIQDETRRELRFIAVGGFTFAALLGRLFSQFTIVDSTPFMKAAYRQRGYVYNGRIRWRKRCPQSPELLFADNIRLRNRFILQAASGGILGRRKVVRRGQDLQAVSSHAAA